MRLRRLALVLLACTVGIAPVWGQQQADSAIGLWRTVDDRTGSERGVVRVFEYNGALYGRIERIFDPAQAALTCVKCADERRDKPLLGLNFLRGLRPDGKDAWSGGEIVDPETGSVYRASARLTDGGDKLVVRGYLLIGLLGRSQTWTREK